MFWRLDLEKVERSGAGKNKNNIAKNSNKISLRL